MSLLHHGGRLLDMAERYGIEESDWLDLSTGVSPWHYPVPDIPTSAWNRLPEDEDGLSTAADRYYGGCNALPVAGSQAAIQTLPQVLGVKRGGPGRVLLPEVGYKEHERAWRMQGWQVEYYGKSPELSGQAYTQLPTAEQIARCDVLLLINPNNPAAGLIPVEQMTSWLEVLTRNGGYLIVDEAFMDSTPEHSVNGLDSQNLIVLRSIGKFFGLAGVRAGFLFAPTRIREAVQEFLGPWCLSGPARYITAKALADTEWQQLQSVRLKRASTRLRQLLLSLGEPVAGTSLFQCVYLPQAPVWFEHLCQHGVLTRLTDEGDALRFGLPADEEQWARLSVALQSVLTDMVLTEIAPYQLS
ncbi:threonine-phosphate decarboxylase CobD [uncultured Shewanella sp.]|uniref:threonine-phosphate decarboxylase CobD n=1 Tax=Shewanella atlantica TaxID=271099 RepID=UPI002638F5AE|nr:threonine-phosphate decarboxylase CobD [uncultured Shewanella sp.]